MSENREEMDNLREMAVDHMEDLIYTLRQHAGMLSDSMLEVVEERIWERLGHESLREYILDELSVNPSHIRAAFEISGREVPEELAKE